MREIAVLFARTDSVYKTMPALDVWDIDRDARKWGGGCPVVAHPPCRAWGRLAHMAKPRDDEKDLARFAVRMVQQWGGVLEHPARSALWVDMGLPLAGSGRDKFGGWTLPIFQQHWGHRAEKATLLYVVGVSPFDLPPIPLVLGEASHVVASSDRTRRRPEISKAERERTPPDFARWLVNVASRASIA